MFCWLDNSLVIWDYWQRKANFYNWWSRKELVEVNVGVPKDLGYEVTMGGRCGGCNGKLNMVYYKVHGEIDGKGKLLVRKFESLQKHNVKQKCKIACPRCTMG